MSTQTNILATSEPDALSIGFCGAVADANTLDIQQESDTKTRKKPKEREKG